MLNVLPPFVPLYIINTNYLLLMPRFIEMTLSRNKAKIISQFMEIYDRKHWAILFYGIFDF
jgi:hypothetical protein